MSLPRRANRQAERLDEFAAAVGAEGPVCVRGGGTQWSVGGSPAPGVREVVAPSGVVHHEPAEMVVRVNAGTTVAELQESVGQAGQWVPLEASEPQRATVGGLLAVGRAGYRRLRYGPVRDALLEARFVTADGSLAKAGGPLVKNVTGFDVCRLLVGSLGTLGLFGEVVLRCLPVPQVARWWVSRSANPFDTWAALYRPSAVLWDGASTWAGLEGEAVEVVHQAASVLGSGWEEVARPPSAPGPHRRSVPPAALRKLGGAPPAGEWMAEIGVGVVHADDAAMRGPLAALGPAPAVAPEVRALHRELKVRFDPAGRLNPGRDALRASA